MNIFLGIQNNYHYVEIALFHDNTIIDRVQEDKHTISKQFVILLNQLLQKNDLTLNEISFIAVNQGPGPFTTLRVVITCVNGLSFATGIPLIGIDGFDAFIHEHTNTHFPITFYLLNAFNQDVYIASTDYHTVTYKGYCSINSLLTRIAEQYPTQTIRFIGNGAALYRNSLLEHLGTHIYIPDPLPLTPSIQSIGTLGLQTWINKKVGSSQLLPLYLKAFPVQ